jgi:hypothetical protein
MLSIRTLPTSLFPRVLRRAGGNQLKWLHMNNLRARPAVSNQVQSGAIKPNQVIF